MVILVRKKFLNALQITKETVNSLNFMIKSRMKSTYFTRKSAKMNFSNAIYFILRNITKSLQIELDDFYDKCLESGITMTKQAFSQLRQRIKPEAFIDLNNTFINWFYDDDQFKRFRGFRLLAIDGSITEIPNTKESGEYFGYYNNKSERKLPRAMASVIYDIENDFILESKICNWKSSERAVAKELIESLEIKGFKNDLIIFDRGYPSKEFVSFLESKGLKYLIRVKTSKFSTEIDNANEEDQIIKVPYKNGNLKIRVINVKLDTGTTEKLITNLSNEDFGHGDFAQLYFKRWGVEIKYNELKNRYQLENFSGNNPISIMQDFYSAIYLSNMISIAKSDANEKAKEGKKDLKYEYKVNTNILIGKIRPVLIESLLTDNLKKRAKIYDKAMKTIIKNLIPVRPNRSFSRKEPPRKNKYSFNKKNNM